MAKNSFRDLASLVRDVERWRAINEDVFTWPAVEMSLLYTIEEITEVARAYQVACLPNHLRNRTEKQDIALEIGEALFMLATVASQTGVRDLSQALQKAIDHLEIRCEKKRAENEK